MSTILIHDRVGSDEIEFDCLLNKQSQIINKINIVYPLPLLYYFVEDYILFEYDLLFRIEYNLKLR